MKRESPEPTDERTEGVTLNRGSGARRRVPLLGVAGRGHRCDRGRVGALSLVDGVSGTVGVVLDGHWSDPRRAYPAHVRDQMPAAVLWWVVACVTVGALVAATAVAWRLVEPQMAREVLGRRPYDLRGSRPRPWARPRDLRRLRARTLQDRFSLGTIDGRALASEPEAHVAVVAPTRSGKTTRCVIPWLLEHDGPAIVTSTKRDVLDATLERRSAIGRVFVFDPFGLDCLRWSPLDGCDDWSFALRQASWLADATQEGDSDIAGYWRGEGAKLLAPLLHAAALDGRAMVDVVAWLDAQDDKEPARILQAHGAEAAAKQLRGVLGLDPRNRGTTVMSASSVLAAYRFPEVAAITEPGFSARHLLDGAANTLYVVSSEREQRLLAPIVVALLSSLLHAAGEHANRHGALKPTLRVLIDEAANVAPLRDLPKHLSQAAGYGIRLATIWQSLAQLRERYRGEADTVLANSFVKIFMGPVSDDATRRYVQHSLDVHLEGERRNRSVASSRALRQLENGRVFVEAGAHMPCVSKVAPYWQRRGSKRAGRLAQCLRRER